MFRYIFSGSDCTRFTESSYQRFQSSLQKFSIFHCVKGVRIRSCSGPYFSAFGLNTERYRVFVFNQNIGIQNMRIQSECGKMQTRITPDRGTFYTLFKVTFLKQKQRSMTKKTEVSLISLALLYLAQPHVFWK